MVQPLTRLAEYCAPKSVYPVGLAKRIFTIVYLQLPAQGANWSEGHHEALRLWRGGVAMQIVLVGIVVALNAPPRFSGHPGPRPFLRLEPPHTSKT
eukprot:7311893-Pyramimonas_sp.AAC.1